MITYNITDLLRIGCLIVPGLELSLDNSAEPSTRANKRRTRRGCRAGRLKKRHIDVVITTRIPQTSTVKRKVCTQNVIQLGGERYTSSSTNCFIEPALINHTRSVQLDVQCLNVRSVKNKALSVADMVISRDIDILALTETWLGSAIDDHVIHELVPRGYEFHAVSRSGGKRGGGVAVLHKSGLKLKKVSPRGHFTHFEHADYHVMIHGVTFRLCIIYRPPPSKRNGLVNTVFFDQWSAYLDIVMLDSHNIIITGDLNFHLDNPAELDVRRFSETLADRGMTQLVKFPTHRGGHILDVVIVRETGSIISGLPTVYDPCLCDKQGNISGDHLSVRFAVHASKPARLRKVVTFRRLRQICVSDFAQDIASSMDLSSDGSVTELVLHYNSDLRSIVDYHAPLQKATVTLRPNSPWFTDTLRQEKRNRRQLERTWLRTGLEVHRQAYRTKCVAFNRLLLTTKSEYFSEKIAICGRDQKQLFHITKNIMGDTGTTNMPSFVSPGALAQRFSDHFTDKVRHIRQGICDRDDNQSSITRAALSDDVCFDGVPLTNFVPITESDVERLVAIAPCKTCELDPIPTWLLKQCSSELVPLITTIINASLTKSVVPPDFKRAVIRPLLKKSTLDKEGLQNYRPVSNLPFASKLVEKVVARQMNDHVDGNTLRDKMQSAYRSGHSTETALLRIKNDIDAALDRKSMVILVMLDLSSAFDTIEHEVLLTRLEHTFGITDKALAWLRSYLSERHQNVVVDSSMSADYVLQCGVPQGSVLGPVLYCMYTRPVCDIVARHGMQYHCYADDIQIYATVGRDQCIAAALLKIEACVVEVADWMVRNQLKLNKDKSQAIIFHTVKQSPHVPVDTYVNIAGQRVRLATSVRNLGVLFDSALTMESQVASVAKTCYYQIRNIGQIRSCITSDACKILVHALVTSRLDYCNALLYGLPQTMLKRLQRVQNCAARLICRRKKHDHVTPLLKELHWLPIHVRPTYKLLTIAYSVMHGLAPEYLAELLDRHRPRRVLRSASAELFSVPFSQTVRHGDRRFSVAVATLWNQLPNSVRMIETLPLFRTHLKTHLFRVAFS